MCAGPGITKPRDQKASRRGRQGWEGWGRTGSSFLLGRVSAGDDGTVLEVGPVEVLNAVEPYG